MFIFQDYVWACNYVWGRTYVCACVCTYVWGCTYVCVHLCVYAPMCEDAPICVYNYVCILPMCVYAPTCVHLCMGVHLCLHAPLCDDAWDTGVQMGFWDLMFVWEVLYPLSTHVRGTTRHNNKYSFQHKIPKLFYCPGILQNPNCSSFWNQWRKQANMQSSFHLDSHTSHLLFLCAIW